VLRTVWPGALGATIQTSRSSRGTNLAIVDVEAMRKRQRCALADVGRDVVAYTVAICSSGNRIITTSASFTASPIEAP
jgi:hypothetical protein